MSRHHQCIGFCSNNICVSNFYVGDRAVNTEAWEICHLTLKTITLPSRAADNLFQPDCLRTVILCVVFNTKSSRMDSAQPLFCISGFDVMCCVGNDTKDTLKCVLNRILNHLQMWFWSNLRKTRFMWFLLSRLPGYDIEKHIRAGSPNTISEEQMTKKTFFIWQPAALMRLKAAAGRQAACPKGWLEDEPQVCMAGNILKVRWTEAGCNRGTASTLWFTIIIQGHWALWVQHYYWGLLTEWKVTAVNCTHCSDRVNMSWSRTSEHTIIF